MPCRVGVQLPEVERAVPWPEMVAVARAAENAGFDSIWLGDHLLYELPDGEVRGALRCRLEQLRAKTGAPFGR